MNLIFVWLFLAFVIECAVETLVLIFPVIKTIKIDNLNIERILALVIALLYAFGTNLDFFMLFEIAFYIPYVGVVTTALFMAAGSSMVHKILQWIDGKKI